MHRRRHLAGCLIALVACVGIVLLALAAGDDAAAAPALPEVLTADGAPGCLGRDVAVVQSGVFVDLHAGAGGHGAEDGATTARVGRGRIDPGDDVLALSGRCAAGTGDAGRAYTATLGVREPGDDTRGPVLEGTLRVDDTEQRVTMVEGGAATPAAVDTAGDDRLEGSALVSRAFLAVGMVVMAARLAGALCARLGQPAVIGEITAGIALGPSLAGAVLPDATAFFFPVEVTGALDVVAQLGLVFFMFLVGLELDLPAVRSAGPLAAAISQVSVALPFALGTALAVVLFPLVGTGDFGSFALFLGVSLSITAFPVLARILDDTGLDRTRVGVLAITCAATTDVLAWCVLSFVVTTATSSGMADVVATVGLTILFVAAMVGVVRPLLARALPAPGAAGAGGGRRTAGPHPTAVLVTTLLLAAWATDAIGVHAIFGAFLAGAIVPRRPDLVASVRDHLQHLTFLVLLPTYFMVVGLSTRIGLLDRPALWAVTALVIVAAVAGKWGGTAVAARAGGVPWREASALGVLMNARGLTELIVLTIGRDLGIISPGLFSAMVVMALVTTAMTAPFATRLVPVAVAPRPSGAVPGVAAGGAPATPSAAPGSGPVPGLPAGDLSPGLPASREERSWS